MKQITQNELIELIKEKQNNATNMEESLRIRATSRDDLDTARICFGEARAYQDMICYLDCVEIVPEEKIVTTIPKAKLEELGITQEDLKKMIEKTPITPYIEPKVEPLRNDRFIEFERIDREGYSVKEIVDAKSIVFIRFYDNAKEVFVVEIWGNGGYVNEKTFTEEARAKAYYKELVEWWKYWKEKE